MNPSNEVQNLPAALVLVVLTSDADSKQYFLVAEKVLLGSVDMRTAMYFTFDIAYPKPYVHFNCSVNITFLALENLASQQTIDVMTF